jgi:rare lipoprotein A
MFAKNTTSLLILFFTLLLTSCVPKDSGTYYPSNNSNYIPTSRTFEENKEIQTNFKEDSNINNGASMHKYTMRRYCVEDKCYTPSIISIGTKYRGVASWYGEKFHGKKTSNGEIYNMYGLSAAHKTFPMNTIVRVENLTNGKTVTLRVNDRGPFVDDRIIDLSFGAAKQISSDKKGLTEVELTVLGFNGQINSPLSFNSVPKKNSYKPQREFIQESLGIQLGSFANKENAIALVEKYKNNYYDVKIYTNANNEQQILHRVRVIGFKSLEEIENYKNKYNLTNAITVGIK